MFTMNIQENKFDINIWFALEKIKALNGNNSSAYTSH